MEWKLLDITHYCYCARNLVLRYELPCLASWWQDR